MDSGAERDRDWLQRALAGDRRALAELFDSYRPRLERMVALRMDWRLRARVDPSDVVQDTYLDVCNRLVDYAANPAVSFYVWVRGRTEQRLIDLYRYHVKVGKRSAGRDVSIDRNDLRHPAPAVLAEQLLGHMTSAWRVAARAEARRRVQEALALMDELDREVIVLRHFEELSNAEAGEILGIKPNAVNMRHARALTRLKAILDEVSGLGQL